MPQSDQPHPSHRSYMTFERDVRFRPRPIAAAVPARRWRCLSVAWCAEAEQAARNYPCQCLCPNRDLAGVHSVSGLSLAFLSMVDPDGSAQKPRTLSTWWRDRAGVITPSATTRQTLIAHSDVAASLARDAEVLAQEAAGGSGQSGGQVRQAAPAGQGVRQQALSVAQTADGLATALRTAPPSGILDVEKLETAFKWTAAGFSTLVAILLFFGIKEGVLDQALRLNPEATLCVFILLGLGVVAALFSPAVGTAVAVRVWAVMVAIFVMGFLTSLFLPNFEQLERSQQALRQPFIARIASEALTAAAWAVPVVVLFSAAYQRYRGAAPSRLRVLLIVGIVAELALVAMV